MKKNMKRTALSLATVLAVVLVLCGCDQKSGNAAKPDYIAVQMSEGENWSIIDKDGKMVVEEEYPADAQISCISDGVFWVKQDGKYQLFSIDNPKKPVIDEEFTAATEFHAGRAVVGSPNQPIRIINTQGVTVATLPENVKSCLAFSDDGYAVFITFENNNFGILDTNGQMVVKAEYNLIYDFREGVALAQKSQDDTKMLIIDTKGKQLGEISTEKYELCTYFCEDGKFLVKPKGVENGSIIVLDKTGKKLFDIKKAKSIWHGYKDGYLTFGNGNGKWGVADDKGDIVIRPKYDLMGNIGNGEFYAKKGDKLGIVNDKDETIIDFDYDNNSGIEMSANYMLHDASGYSIVNKEGKELAAFDQYSISGFEFYAEYINVDAIADALVRSIDDYEHAKTARQELENSGLDIDHMHYSSSVQKNLNIRDGKLKGEFTVRYDDNVAKEKYHEEKVDDGWFIATKRVSDGWQWSDALPTSLEGGISLDNIGITAHKLREMVMLKMEHAEGSDRRFLETEFVRHVKAGGTKLDVYTRLTAESDNNLWLRISYVKNGKAADSAPADTTATVN